MTMSGGSGSGTGGGGLPPAPRANVLPTVGVHTATEVTFPRRNLDAGLAAYSIKSETYDPRPY
jgi:hypothetical protein